MWRRQWHPTPVLLPGKSHGWRSLEGCSPWGCWGLDATERLHFHFSLSRIREGNGNPLQCSCLGNPRDRGAWWAAVYGVTQSRTQLKWLSSRNWSHPQKPWYRSPHFKTYILSQGWFFYLDNHTILLSVFLTSIWFPIFQSLNEFLQNLI